ncbi:MAG TPA: hypothetical protein VG713_15275, partial [Pirellulales bacterium]|nr:hypothetical protein [Pirellulales bacterium]
DAAKLAGETLSGQMDKLWNSFDNIAAIVGEAVAPILKSLVGEVTGFAQSLDTAQGKAKVFEVVGKTIGYTADAAQLLAIGWKTAQVGMDALVLAGVKGFEWLLKGIQYAVDGAAALGWVSEDTAKGFGRFVKEVEAFSAGAESNLASDGKAAADAWNEPWASAKIEQKFKSIANASQDAGKKMAESFSEPMKQLSKETAEAHGEIDKLVKDLRVGIETFGMSDTEKKAKELATKGVGQDKIDEFRTLSNELKGKELAKSLENPIEKFQREMSKLAELKDNLSPEMFQRAQSKLVKELQDAVPDMKTTAGGAMAAGSQEARSALVAYANSGRNNDPQQKLVQINEQQKVILESANRALQRLASPNAMGQGGLPFPGL